MRVTKSTGWVLGLGLVGCVLDTKSGGEIVDTESGSSEDGEAESGAEAACGAAGVCGNGVVEALEACDGDEGCDACARVGGATVLRQSDDVGAIAFAADGSWLATTRAVDDAPVLRRYDVDGNELWSQVLTGVAAVPADVALDAAGRAYFAGGLANELGDAATPWMAAWDPEGAPLWESAAEDPGYYAAITSSGDRIAAVGGYTPDVAGTSLVRVVDASGEEIWTLGDSSLESVLDATFVGTELVITGRRWIPAGVDQIELRRYDALATVVWSLDLPYDEASAIHHFGVVADGAQGTWTFGDHELHPYAVHHASDGSVLEVLDCLGPDRGHIVDLTVDGTGRVGLAIAFAFGNTPTEERSAWFAIVQAGTVVSGAAPGPGTVATTVDLRGGRLVAGWGDEAAGKSTLAIVP